jgi:hypothetical protein
VFDGGCWQFTEMGSNHLALACELAFVSGILNFNTNNPGRVEQYTNVAFSGTVLFEMMMYVLLLHWENSSTTLLNVPFLKILECVSLSCSVQTDTGSRALEG